jgi:uncharacterized membrane protein YedE/YeeE
MSQSETAARWWLLPAAALVALLFAVFVGYLQRGAGDGRALVFAALSGALFGLLLQRSRFCFYCITRDWLERRDGRGLLGLVAALAVGTLAYHAVFGAFLPLPNAPRLPPGAHIGPVSGVLALGALLFGIGMALAGSCISAQLYRLGEGSLAAPLALVGTLIGFVLGFLSWNTLYLRVIQEAPVLWLPHLLGYGGSLALQLVLLGAAAWWLGRRLPVDDAPSGSLWQAIWGRRWPAYVGGVLIGALGAIVYLRSGPLGVTAELGSIARTAADRFGLLPARLEGLDGFSGCATVVKETLWSSNGVFIVALVLGSLFSALLAGDFHWQLPSVRGGARTLAGGVLMGWGAMVALGCTVGTLLSGVMAAAVSGWLFALFCFAGVWIGWRLRRRLPD